MQDQNLPSLLNNEKKQLGESDSCLDGSLIMEGNASSALWRCLKI
jgi:hypothetical protein